MVGEVIQEDVPSMVLFRTPIEAKESYDVGFHFERLNLGNLHFSTGKIPLRKTFCCSSEEMEALKYLYRKGVRLLYQPSPDNFPQVIIFSD
jgi:PTS system mannose-specific IIB component